MFDSGSVVVPADGEAYLGKFCFGYDPSGDPVGRVAIQIKAPPTAKNEHLELHFYDDQATSYPGQTAEWNRLTCEQKKRHAMSSWPFPAQATTDEGWNYIVNITERIRPRWWYVVISDCSGREYRINYEIHFKNTQQPPYELSHDMRWVPTLLALMLAAYSVIFAAQLYATCCHVAGGDQTSHPVVRIVIAAILVAVFEVSVKILHYNRYKEDGRGIWVAYLLGKLGHEVSKFLVMAICLLVSKGRCVSSGLESGDAWKMLKMLGPFVMFCFIVEVWGEESEANNYNDTFVYKTPHGMTVLTADVALLIIYLINLIGTWGEERNPTLRRFYRIWGSAYALWFVSLPVSALISMAVMAPWVRHTFATAASHICQAAALVTLVLGLWPCQTAPYLVLGDTELVDAGYKFTAGDGSCAQRWPSADVVGRRGLSL